MILIRASRLSPACRGSLQECEDSDVLVCDNAWVPEEPEPEARCDPVESSLLLVVSGVLSSDVLVDDDISVAAGTVESAEDQPARSRRSGLGGVCKFCIVNSCGVDSDLASDTNESCPPCNASEEPGNSSMESELVRDQSGLAGSSSNCAGLSVE